MIFRWSHCGSSPTVLTCRLSYSLAHILIPSDPPVTKLINARSSAKEAAERAIHDLQIWQEACKKQYEKAFAGILENGGKSDTDLEDLRVRVDKMAAELANFQRIIRQHASNTS